MELSDYDRGYNDGLREIAGAVALAYGHPGMVPPKTAAAIRRALAKVKKAPRSVVLRVERIDDAGP